MIDRSAENAEDARSSATQPMLRALLRGWEAMGDPRFIEAATPMLEQWSATTDPDDGDLFETAATSEALARIAVLDPQPEDATLFAGATGPLLDRLAASVTPTHPDDPRPAGLLLGRPEVGRQIPIAAQCHLLAALHCLDAGELPC